MRSSLAARILGILMVGAVSSSIVSCSAIVSLLPIYGEQGKRDRGYQRCAAVIQALASYHADNRSYPASLEELAPRYLEKEMLGVPTRPQEEYPLKYGLTESSYWLEFTYVGPGMNHCKYTPENDWICTGYL